MQLTLRFKDTPFVRNSSPEIVATREAPQAQALKGIVLRLTLRGEFEISIRSKGEEAGGVIT